MWKLIAMNEVVDHELAKQFSDIGGHDAIIEILLCNQKGPSSKVKIYSNLALCENTQWIVSNPSFGSETYRQWSYRNM